MIDVLLVDDHPVMRQLLRELLESHDDLTIVGEAGNGEDAVTEVTKLQPSVVIVGLTAGVQGHTEKAMLAAGAVAIIDKAEVFEALYPAILQAVRRQVA